MLKKTEIKNCLLIYVCGGILNKLRKKLIKNGKIDKSQRKGNEGY